MLLLTHEDRDWHVDVIEVEVIYVSAAAFTDVVAENHKLKFKSKLYL